MKLKHLLKNDRESVELFLEYVGTPCCWVPDGKNSFVNWVFIDNSRDFIVFKINDRKISAQTAIYIKNQILKLCTYLKDNNIAYEYERKGYQLLITIPIPI